MTYGPFKIGNIWKLDNIMSDLSMVGYSYGAGYCYGHTSVEQWFC